VGDVLHPQAAEQLLARAADDLAEGVVDERELPREIALGDADRRLVDDAPVARLAVVQ
jgi:hypothetical protein